MNSDFLREVLLDVRDAVVSVIGAVLGGIAGKIGSLGRQQGAVGRSGIVHRRCAIGSAGCAVRINAARDEGVTKEGEIVQGTFIAIQQILAAVKARRVRDNLCLAKIILNLDRTQIEPVIVGLTAGIGVHEFSGGTIGICLPETVCVTLISVLILQCRGDQQF